MSIAVDASGPPRIVRLRRSMNAGQPSVCTVTSHFSETTDVHLDEAVRVVRRAEQDQERVGRVVVGLRALSEIAEVVAHERVQVEQFRELLQLVGLGMPDVEPEVLVAVEQGLHGCNVDLFLGRPIGLYERPRHARMFARRAGKPPAVSPCGRS